MVRAHTPPTAAGNAAADKPAPVRPDIVRKLRELNLPIDPQEYCNAERAGVAAACHWFFRLQAKPICIAEADIQNSARLGVWSAARRFDPEQGCKFITYAVPYAMGYARRHVRDGGAVFAVPRQIAEGIPQITKARLRLTGELGREPTFPELAATLHWPVSRVAECLTYQQLQFPESLDVLTGESKEVSRAELVPDDRPDFTTAILREAALGHALGRINARLSTLLKHRYLDQATQAETARRMGLSQMHICRLERQALQKLRKVWPH